MLVADLDFMGQRARIDDIALTLYYTCSTFANGIAFDVLLQRLCILVAAYNSGLAEPLTDLERAALPLALARTPLAFVAMIAVVDSEAHARQLTAEMDADVLWALRIVHDLDHRQSMFTAHS